MLVLLLLLLVVVVCCSTTSSAKNGFLLDLRLVNDFGIGFVATLSRCDFCRIENDDDNDGN